MHEISGVRWDRKALTHFHSIDPLSGRIGSSASREKERERKEEKEKDNRGIMPD